MGIEPDAYFFSKVKNNHRICVWNPTDSYRSRLITFAIISDLWRSCRAKARSRTPADPAPALPQVPSADADSRR